MGGRVQEETFVGGVGYRLMGPRVKMEEREGVAEKVGVNRKKKGKE